MSVTDFEEERTHTEDDLTLFGDERRREIIAVLQQQETPIARRDLAEEVAAAERDTTPADVSEQAVDRVQLTLHHNHLPKLDDAGYLRYDDQWSQITPEFAGENFQDIPAEL